MISGWKGTYNGQHIKRSEVIDLSLEGNVKCFDWVDTPSYDTGGLVSNTVLVCGGKFWNDTDSDECHSLTADASTFITKMSVARIGSASVVINDDTTLWISGGESDVAKSSSEYINLGRTMSGPDLPVPLDGHQMVSINATFTMIIKGPSICYSCTGTSSTFYYNHVEKTWMNGPDLSLTRKKFAAGIVTDQVTLERLVIVTGGRPKEETLVIGHHGLEMTDSTEILLEDQWITGNI